MQEIIEATYSSNFYVLTDYRFTLSFLNVHIYIHIYISKILALGI